MPWFLAAPTGHHYPIGAEGLKLGRAADNDVVLPDEEVSRRHAFLQLQGDAIWVMDQGSFNGVFVNDIRVSSSQVLQAGDVLRLGRTRFVVEWAAAQAVRQNAAAPTPAPVSGSAPSPAGAPAPATPKAWQAALIGAGVGLLALALVLLLFVRPLLNRVAGATPASANPYAAYTDALQATAFILAPIGDTPNSNAGTGVVINENGRLLTAYSVVFDSTTERPYNRKSQALIGLSSSGRQAGQALDRWYLARVVRGDRQRDLAVLQIFALEDGSPLPNSFSIEPAPLGNAQQLQPGDSLAVISFPTAGIGQSPDQVGRIFTIGEGKFSEFRSDSTIGDDRGWLQSDISLSLTSNVGGLALDGRGRLVGIYTGASSGGGSLLRPLHVADPLLAGAR